MKKILGLDLGTNSIGWALINHTFEEKQGEILGLGSRIIPMSQDVLGKFDSGVTVSQTSERTSYRAIRRLYQRDNLRRERLHRILHLIGFLPPHYINALDFDKKLGQFKENTEPKLNYKQVEIDGKKSFQFIFHDSFLEMVSEFKEAQPSLFYEKINGEETKIPYDWTIYYLRKKALKEKITKEELAWLILHFNQKRGYYQLRGDEEETEGDKTKEYVVLKVKSVIDTGENVKGKALYSVIFENDWTYDRLTTQPEEWLNATKEFITTTSVTKSGEIKRTFKAVDSEKDWIAIKKKSEQDINTSGLTVGQYIYSTLLTNPTQKIRGKLIKTIERKFYKDEFKQILEVQKAFHPEFTNTDTYSACIKELYPNNEAHRSNIKDKDLSFLLLNDIIFYQRPLKSKKSLIAGCTFEVRKYKTIKDGKEIWITESVKSIPKSHPLFQEFRLWQFLQNLKIYQNEGESKIDFDATSNLLPSETDWENLFEFLTTKKEVEQKTIIDYLIKAGKIAKDKKAAFRWNYVEDKKYPAYETRAQFITRLKKVKDIDAEQFLTKEKEIALWHIIYSVKDSTEYESAIKKFAIKNSLNETSFTESFKNFPTFSNDYAAFSHKALNKLLPLMRRGKYWNENDISETIKTRANDIKARLEYIDFSKSKIDNSVSDDDIPKQVLKSFVGFKNQSFIQGLNTYQACYLVYNKHSEGIDSAKWNSPNDIKNYLHKFKQHSLRNPVVEQIVTETLRVVKDIWEYYGDSAENFFDEIHVELGREMSNPAQKRKNMSERNSENENTNQRIRELLIELKSDSITAGDIRPHSPSHQEILKIYEEGIVQNPNADYSILSVDEVIKIRKNGSPSAQEIKKYKLWLEQGYCSPYTGKVIPLSKLFTTDYQIEHIIPQSRYFDNSLSNKVICESEVNQLKGNQTAYEFISDKRGTTVDLGFGNSVKVFTLDEYKVHCGRYFNGNRTKLKKLLSEDIPEGFIDRQLNDSRYISSLIKGLLSNIVKEENEKEATSKHLLPTPGAITSQLKQDWGLNDKWNELIAPRFMRLNELTESNDYGYWDDTINAFRSMVPDDLAKGFNKKRIDHRHHALDALVIACTTRKHVHYLNALNAEKQNYSLRDQLLIKNSNDHFTKNFQLPWSSFPIQAFNELSKTIISFKQNLRVINKANNKTWQWRAINGKLKKELVPQTKGDNWAIRKSLHKETVSGLVRIKYKKMISFANGIKDYENLVDKHLRTIVKTLVEQGAGTKELSKYFKTNPYKIEEKRVTNVEVYAEKENATAVRTALTDKFTRKQLNNVTDTGIKKILENHLKNYSTDEKERFDLAFTPEGVEALNANIITLNNGKNHHPIYKVRLYEEGNKFQVGETGNKNLKYVEAAKGTNLFFAIYWNEEKQKREYETIPFNKVIEWQKQEAKLPKEKRTQVPINPSMGQFLFAISPNDLVYVPTQEEIEQPNLIDFKNLSWEQVNRVYKMVSSSSTDCYFIINNIATAIKNKFEFSVMNKMGRSIDGVMIKEICWKLSLDRLGNITTTIR